MCCSPWGCKESDTTEQADTTASLLVHRIFQGRILELMPCSPPGDLPHPRIEPGSLMSLMSPALASGFLSPSAT